MRTLEGRCVTTVGLFVAILVSLCRCSGFGKCPKHPYMTDFNVTMFIGRWYEVERSFYIMELTSTCMDIDLTVNARGQIEVEVNTRSIWSGNPTVTRGIITQTRKDPSVISYRMISKLPNALNRHLPGTGIYQVLNTDYVNYAILWTCSNLGLIHTDRVWIFGRERDLNVTMRTVIYNFLTSRNIDSERLILPKKANCTE